MQVGSRRHQLCLNRHFSHQLLASSLSRNGPGDIHVLNLEDREERLPVATSPADEFFPQFSPDGRWLAYESNQSGREEVYVVSFPGLDNRRQLSTEGGTALRWSPLGDELFFWGADKTLMVSRITLGDELSWDEPQPLFSAADVEEVYPYAVSSDGQRFLLTIVNRDAQAREIHVATNWLNELRDLTPPD